MTTNDAHCAHEGQLINQCANCIKRAFIAEFPQNAPLIDDDRDCMIIAQLINDYCARIDDHGFGETSSIIDFEDLHERIDTRFDAISPIIIEFIDILVCG
jgi:hypothetical protein